MPREASREHSDACLKRARQQLEQLRAEMGNEIVSKLDRVLLRDLIYDRKDRRLNQLFELPPEPEPVHEMLINASSGRASTAGGRPPSDDRAKRFEEMMRSGQDATKNIRIDLGQDETRVLEVFWLTHSVHAVGHAGQIEKAASRADVRSLNHVKRELATCLNNSRPLIRADQVANTLGFTGAGVTVAVVDTGIDNAHPALAAAVVGQQDFSGAGAGDGFGHGTHCAGIVGSRDKVFVGIAPSANLFSVRVMDNAGSMTPANGVAGIRFCVQIGAQVSSNSWGFTHQHGVWSDSDGTCILCTAADNAVKAGVVMVIAAGNEDNTAGGGLDTHLRCPGIARSAVTVAASDKADAMAPYSSVEPTPDGRAKPDLTAPGSSINSCKAAGTALGPIVDPPTNDFIMLSGTSMATPHVAGVAALMLQKRPALTPAQVKGILMASVVNLGAPANSMGTGRIDALTAVNAS